MAARSSAASTCRPASSVGRSRAAARKIAAAGAAKADAAAAGATSGAASERVRVMESLREGRLASPRISPSGPAGLAPFRPALSLSPGSDIGILLDAQSLQPRMVEVADDLIVVGHNRHRRGTACPLTDGEAAPDLVLPKYGRETRMIRASGRRAWKKPVPTCGTG